jgi:hypothetical protein
MSLFHKCTRNGKSTHHLRVDAPFSRIFVFLIPYHDENQHDFRAKSSGASNTSDNPSLLIFLSTGLRQIRAFRSTILSCRQEKNMTQCSRLACSLTDENYVWRWAISIVDVQDTHMC